MLYNQNNRSSIKTEKTNNSILLMGQSAKHQHKQTRFVDDPANTIEQLSVDLLPSHNNKDNNN